MSDQQIRALYDDGSYDFVPHDGMRRTIAQRLTASVQTIPHFYLTIDCDIGKLLEAREEINASAPAFAATSRNFSADAAYTLNVSAARGKLNPVPPHSATRCGVPLSLTGMSVETVPGVCPGVSVNVSVVSPRVSF